MRGIDAVTVYVKLKNYVQFSARYLRVRALGPQFIAEKPARNAHLHGVMIALNRYAALQMPVALQSACPAAHGLGGKLRDKST